jgi:hypothetical protein
MASADTFDVPPIAGFVQKYLLRARVSVDPFARNKRWATYTNDLDPRTAAESHMEAADFLMGLWEQGIVADLIILDPPYGPRQIAECYAGLGLSEDQARAVKARKPTTQVAWSNVKNLASALQRPGGIALTFGWNSGGFGIQRGYEPIEIMLVCHGAGHNDTLCVAEVKQSKEDDLFQ